MLSNGFNIKGRGHVNLYARQGVSSSSNHHEKRRVHRLCKEDKRDVKDIADMLACSSTSHSLAFTEI